MRVITRHSIAENILTLISGSAFGQVIISIALFLVVRMLGTRGAGQYIACFALAKLTSVLFELGMDSFVLKEGGGNPNKIGELISSNLFLKIGFGAIWFVGLYGLSFFLNQSTYPRDLLLVAVLATWLESLNHSFLSGFKTTLSNRITAILSISSSLVLVATTIVLLAMDVDDPLPYALLRLGIVTIFVLISGLWFSRRHKLTLLPKALTQYRRDSYPFFLSAALATVYTQADITLVAVFLGEAEAGIYGISSKIINFLFIVPLSVFSVMVPVLSNLYENKDERLKRTIRRMLNWMLVLGTAMWIFVGLFGKPVLEILLGIEFQGAGEILVILSVIVFTKAWSFATASILVSVGRQRRRVVVQAVVTLINIVLSVSLIKLIGLKGAAFAFVISETILMLGYSVETIRWKQTQKMRA
ncbi:MAG: oligosaccharide flippase family protein [Candidatus Hermodarchaeia archaeon]|jgi:O-antigen/teichoic acid export membrane protein